MDTKKDNNWKLTVDNCGWVGLFIFVVILFITFAVLFKCMESEAWASTATGILIWVILIQLVATLIKFLFTPIRGPWN